MEIQELKSRLSIFDVAEALGIVIGKNDKALCPFHADKTPSLQFSRAKNICTCFSSNCDAGTMDIISLTVKYKKVSTHEALLWLSELAGEKPPMNTGPISPSRSPLEFDRSEILTDVFKFFKQSFLNSSPAQKYAESRGLNHKKLEIGYNTGTFHYNKSPETIKIYEQLGLLKKHQSGGHSVFGKGCLVFVMRNKENKITSFYFRAVEPRPKSMKHVKDATHLYLTKRQGLYPKYPDPGTKQIILPECIIDSATLMQLPEFNDYGIVSSYGTEGIKEQFEAISELKHLQDVTIWFDGDASGRDGAIKRATELQKMCPGIKLSIVNTPVGTDINSLFVQQGAKILTELLKKRTGFKPDEFISEEKQPAPPEPGTDKPVLDTTNPNKLIMRTGLAYYYVKGGLRKDLDSMKVTIEIEHPGTHHKSRAKTDLYEDRLVEKLARDAGEKLNLRADLIELDLNTLTDLLDGYRDLTMTNKKPKKDDPEQYIFTEMLKRAVNVAKSKQPIEAIGELLGKAGIVGEDKNRLFAHLVAFSHKLHQPLHLLIQGSSGSGKTRLMRVICECMPPEMVIRLTRVSDKGFYNYPEDYLIHKLFALEDVDGLSEEADFAYRELISNNELISNVSLRDENGNNTTGVRKVNGPIASMACTTNGSIYEDNVSRMFIIAVDESREQSKRIIAYQNAKSAGKLNRDQEKEARILLQHVARVLKPFDVVNPFADKIDLPDDVHKERRLNELFKEFIHIITVVNQYHRKKDAYNRLISQPEDIKLAIDFMFDCIVLKVDELDGSLRQFFEKLKKYLKTKEKPEKYQFTQREIRQELNLSKASASRYITDLVKLEYIEELSAGNKRKVSYVVEFWDDYANLRARIKKHLYDQLNKIIESENKRKSAK